ncbi:hypothetical protein LNAOJCKE_0405 [Methylorubrum aminovorans]|uniref:Uncharacterized protein n=1 Tax=Methylorubrum aminovorans TaxID=269069 RepID=A0ABQ4U7I8_9HYPH|nr:hypothetical protein [Methylorubrum aminovorans]GJE63211.1 hypothetical protein LNAOJCKE_0405 [Methylorubrum aminovorans]GMA79253.1 hypothetical protein GCM10025880_56700 [Methylorubrum aminovorans]
MAEPTMNIYSFDIDRENAIGVEAPEANGLAYVERQFISFDELDGVNHRDYKRIERIDPIGIVPEGSAPVLVSVGWADTPGEPMEFGAALPFDAITKRQLDFRSPGRYHGIRIEYEGFHNIRIVGLEIEISLGGKRGHAESRG